MNRRLISEKGTQLVEMAVLCPFLVLVALGATDFARVSYTSITLANAARTGAQYALQSSVHSSNIAAIQAAACTEADDLNPEATCPITVTSSRSCLCPGSATAISCNPTPACGGGVSKELFVTVTATRTFTTLAPYPGIPSSVALTRTAILRVQ